jgi:nucleotide-binding universal stress UspA family protein
VHSAVLDPVVVGVDGSEPGLRALDWAVGDAGRRGLPLRLLHACRGTRTTTAPALRQTDGYADDPVLAAAYRHLGAGSDDANRVEAVRRPGRVVPVLLEALTTSSLLVLGRRSPGLSRGVAGTGLGCALQADRPVVMVPAGWVDPVGPGGLVVVGMDGGPHDRQAVAFAFEQAARRGAALEAVHLWRGADAAVTLSVMTRAGSGPVDAAGHGAFDALQSGRTSHPGVLVLESVERSDRIGGLVRRSTYASLVVVGAPKPGRYTRAALGFTARAVRQVRCPVAVVPAWRPPDATDGPGPA